MKIGWNILFFIFWSLFFWVYFDVFFFVDFSKINVIFFFLEIFFNYGVFDEKLSDKWYFICELNFRIVFVVLDRLKFWIDFDIRDRNKDVCRYFLRILK